MAVDRNSEAPPRLILGTVQLGMPYGIANVSGKPDRAESRAIIAAALENGITHFDTAQAYGESEAVLGDQLHDLGASSIARISTKLAASLDPLDTRRLIASLEESLRKLRVERLWCLLLHQPAWLAQWNNGLGETLCQFRERGLVAHLGVSLASSTDNSEQLANSDLDVIQLPCNAWDRTVADSGLIARLKADGKLCCVRSVYLQGLLAMRPDVVGKRLPAARSASERWWALAEELEIAPAELALRYALGLGAPLVIGAESSRQVRDTARMMALRSLPGTIVHKLADAMSSVLSSDICQPMRWPK